ncbi:glycosyltransferase [Sphingobacterium sp. SGR-19]|uniref:glycosyltransferase n=1 Tax=Sphingobacterium sp. SGR-19 TaxID=2710886 RepID=UPI0013EA314C|nr:glycosyltransferase [Sphingobacterium sp. SGR-19]NGM64056.1 glycosyltransferase family 4 protein [Sphingobacterium sp. SGR-19]
MKTIVVSAVNIVEAGPLAILRDCLGCLSQWVAQQQGAYRVIAIVYKRKLADYPHIEYIETQWPKKRWINRLWYEYVSLRKVSKNIGEVYLWFSLHDTTPTVKAERKAVYCHNALFGYRWKLHDLFFAPKLTLLAILTKYIYRPNIHRNDYVVVQQEWFRKAMHNMFAVNRNKIIVAPPTEIKAIQRATNTSQGKVKSFIYAASANIHKNFEVICRAVDILENQYGITDFQVYLTVRGDENKYARWLYKNWNRLAALRFIGFLPKEKLLDYYDTCDGLIYPSKVESWGLPISEFALYGKYMLLADLPYAHETAGGSNHAAFFDPDSPRALAEAMKKLIQSDDSLFKPVPPVVMTEPIAEDWSVLFNYLINNDE